MAAIKKAVNTFNHTLIKAEIFSFITPHFKKIEQLAHSLWWHI